VEVGQRIKRARRAGGLQQKELAQIVGVTEKTVSNWEIGEHSPHRKLADIATALSVSEASLLGSADEGLRSLLEEQIQLLHAIHDELRLMRLDRLKK
jgi:transcriptional regulator with XRE-family HTH domain